MTTGWQHLVELKSCQSSGIQYFIRWVWCTETFKCILPKITFSKLAPFLGRQSHIQGVKKSGKVSSKKSIRGVKQLCFFDNFLHLFQKCFRNRHQSERYAEVRSGLRFVVWRHLICDYVQVSWICFFTMYFLITAYLRSSQGKTLMMRNWEMFSLLLSRWIFMEFFDNFLSNRAEIFLSCNNSQLSEC